MKLIVGNPNGDVCAMLTGLYSANGLPAPTATCACMDATSSAGLLNLTGVILDQAATGNINILP